MLLKINGVKTALGVTYFPNDGTDKLKTDELFQGLEFDLRKVSARPIKSTLSRSETLLSSRTLLLKPRILRKSKVILLSFCNELGHKANHCKY
jgi:hypothetical protein